MLKNLPGILGRCVVVHLTITLTLLTALAQNPDDKQKKDDQKRQDKAAKAQAKDERRYQKVRIFAENAYDTDPDFKEAVDWKYRELRQKHTEKAYLVNTRLPNMKLVSQVGDKIFFDDTLYGNPLAQDFVNRVGQSVVPKNSTRLYAFKITQNPVPEARALSNGTIYITTGYLSLIDNEAQLAYILGHEIAHVEHDHWFQDILVQIGTQPYLRKNPLKSLIWAFQDAKDMVLDPDTYLKAKLSNVNNPVGWEPFQEDEADMDALKSMFERNYDVREVPKLYGRMKAIASDPRSQTGFIADPQRIKERLSNFDTILSGYIKTGTTAGTVDLSEKRDQTTSRGGSRGIARMLGEIMAPEIQRKLESGELMASSEEFQSTMALVKRDNGIRALQFDMYFFARINLEDSIAIRSNDPFAYYYYGKALKQTARNASEMSKALANLNQAISFDKRQTIAEPYLFRAMLRLGDRNPNEAALIASDLRTYVTIYQRENKGDLPPNMDFVYDFMQDLEVLDYRASPADNTAEAPKAIYGTVPSKGQPISQQTEGALPPVVPAPTPAPGSKRKKP